LGHGDKAALTNTGREAAGQKPGGFSRFKIFVRFKRSVAL
jgi:hypothetical protein